jgi:hypothetical protein
MQREAIRRLLSTLPGDVRAHPGLDPASRERLEAALRLGVEAAKTGYFEKALNILTKCAEALARAQAAQRAQAGGGDGPERTAEARGNGADPDAERSALAAEFATIAEGLSTVIDRAADPVAAKARQAVSAFRLEIDRDPKKAAALLAAMRRFVAEELGRLPVPEPQEQPAGGHFDSLVISSASPRSATEVAPHLVQVVRSDKEARLGKTLGDLGLSMAEQDQIILAVRKDGNAAVEAITKLNDLQKLKLPPGQVLPFLQMTEGSPKAYAAAVKALEKLDPDPDGLDVSTDALARIELDLLANRAELKRNREALSGLQTKMRNATTESEAGLLKELEANARALDVGEEAYEKLTKTRTAADAKKGLVDELTFGRLSPASGVVLTDDERATFIDGFGRDATVTYAALDLLGRGGEPREVAAQLGAMLKRLEGKFADETGKPLGKVDLKKVAANALRQGIRLGGDYFERFDAYLKSGRQHDPDPCTTAKRLGSTGTGDIEKKNRQVVARATAMGDAVLGDDGAPDFTSAKAGAMMDHMLFHPGSMTTYTPHLTDKMLEMKALFSGDQKDAAKAALAQANLPTADAPQRDRGLAIVSHTVNKEPDKLTDRDVKTAVLSAMMTPLSQGPVGSCFATAPVRAIRETQPVEAMKAFTKIASTGMFTAQNGRSIPAHSKPPKGENVLMRSWEYSAAAVAADEQGSRERKQLTGALFSGTEGLNLFKDSVTGASSSLNGIRAIVGASAWEGSADSKGLKSGIRAKLQKAVAQELVFEYDTSAEMTEGAGDGSSSAGAYVVAYEGKPLKTKETFIGAMKKLALKACGEPEDSEVGQKIAALLGSDAFASTLLASSKSLIGTGKDYTPWELESGGWEFQARAALHPGESERDEIVGARPVIGGSGRGTTLLTSLIDRASKSDTKMSLAATDGKDANHAFNLLLGSPDLDKLKGPDSAKKIETTLLKPGERMAKAAIPVEQAATLYLQQVRSYRSDDMEDDLISALDGALKTPPIKPMTAGELKNHLATALKPVLAAKVAAEIKTWKEGKIPKDEEVKKKRAKLEKSLAEGAGSSADAAFAEMFRPPSVDFADTNWGGPEDQIRFALAPDPASGELKVWKKNTFTGALSPAGDNWADAKWSMTKAKAS